MQTLFALMDCNNFYASCERVFNPELAQKPIVILSNNDGCIVARSNEAKRHAKQGEAEIFCADVEELGNLAAKDEDGQLAHAVSGVQPYQEKRREDQHHEARVVDHGAVAAHRHETSPTH